jgi:hypothetical protein
MIKGKIQIFSEKLTAEELARHLLLDKLIAFDYAKRVDFLEDLLESDRITEVVFEDVPFSIRRKRSFMFEANFLSEYKAYHQAVLDLPLTHNFSDKQRVWEPLRVKNERSFIMEGELDKYSCFATKFLWKTEGHIRCLSPFVRTGTFRSLVQKNNILEIKINKIELLWDDSWSEQEKLNFLDMPSSSWDVECLLEYGILRKLCVGGVGFNVKYIGPKKNKRRFFSCPTSSYSPKLFLKEKIKQWWGKIAGIKDNENICENADETPSVDLINNLIKSGALKEINGIKITDETSSVDVINDLIKSGALKEINGIKITDETSETEDSQESDDTGDSGAGIKPEEESDSGDEGEFKSTPLTLTPLIGAEHVQEVVKDRVLKRVPRL